MADTFRFELVSPERLLLSADAAEVLVPGSEGEFTVLPMHAPVLSTLRPGLLDVKLADGGTHQFFVQDGLAEVDPESLTILAQQAIDRESLDQEWLDQQKKNAEEDLADATDDNARDAAQSTLDRLKLIEKTLFN